MSANLTVTDLFAGAGGSSTGMVSVPGVDVRMAANHWKLAIAVHNQNHPDTDHAAVDLHQEDLRYFPRTDMLWASPECTNWSQANATRLPSIEEGLFEDPLSDEAGVAPRAREVAPIIMAGPPNGARGSRRVPPLCSPSASRRPCRLSGACSPGYDCLT